jgi:hypothetical protein
MYSGIDLHLNNCGIALIDETDRLCCERRVPRSAAAQIGPRLLLHVEDQ